MTTRVRQHPPSRNLTPETSDPAWGHALCIGSDQWDAEIHRILPGGAVRAERAEERRARLRKAARACMDCPALHLCRLLPTDGTAGVVAGRIVGGGK